MKNAGKTTKKAQTVLMAAPVTEAESDRRLRPVLDALYLHQSKQALKLVHQALQKRPGWPAARALRACALMQSERLTEAEDEVAEIRADLDAGRVPLDEDCARKLHMYYLETRREGAAGEVFEQAWKASVANVQLAETAFCLYIRGSAFSPAQKIATKLHRFASAKTQKYGLWATAALWLGLACKKFEVGGSDGKSDTRMLKLASAMLSKALDSSDKIPSAEMVRFGVRIYKEAGEFNRAHDLVSNPRLVMDEAEMLHLRSQLSICDESCDSDHRLLLSEYDADDWAHWLNYLESIQKRPDWETEASDFVNKAISIERDSTGAKRGPFLAQMELQYKCKELHSLSKAVVQYFAMFGGKTVCAHDLRPYVQLLRCTEWFDIVFDEISEIVEQSGGRHHLTMSWLRTWYSLLDDSTEALFSHYYQQVSEQKEPTDRQPGDDYLLLAAHRLLPGTDLSLQDRYSNSSAVLQAIAILEAGLSLSPFNFHLKLLLVRLYTEVGALCRVEELWDSLEIKHVQLATLTNLVLRPCFDAGHHDSCRDILDSMEGLWRECDQEIPECISKAFQVGSINAATEFVLFRKRLERSVVLAEAMVTEVLHELASSRGEPIGVKRALNCIISMPRFTVNELSKSVALIDNNDYHCLEFWEVTGYNSGDRRRCLEDRVAEEGVPCSSGQTAIIVADLRSLETLLRLAVTDESSEQSGAIADVNETKLLLTNDSNVEFPPHTTLRNKIAANLKDVKQLLNRNTSGSSVCSTESTEGRYSSASEVLKSSQAVTQVLLNHVRQIVSNTACNGNGRHKEGNGTTPEWDHNLDSQNEGSADAKFSPVRLRKCGRMVFDSLLVTCVALLSFSSDLMRARRRAKKSAARAGDQKQLAAVSDFECAREAILEYQQALLHASSLIQSWVTSALGNDLDWATSIFTDGQELEDMVSFLPGVIAHIDLKNGCDKGDDLKRSDFCDGILTQICSSHAKSCKNILEVLTSITSRLNMVDL